MPRRLVQVHHLLMSFRTQILGTQTPRRWKRLRSPLPPKERGERWACLAIFFPRLGLGDFAPGDAWNLHSEATGVVGCRLDSPSRRDRRNGACSVLISCTRAPGWDRQPMCNTMSAPHPPQPPQRQQPQQPQKTTETTATTSNHQQPQPTTTATANHNNNKLGGTRPDRLAEVRPQEQVQRQHREPDRRRRFWVTDARCSRAADGGNSWRTSSNSSISTLPSRISMCPRSFLEDISTRTPVREPQLAETVGGSANYPVFSQAES